MKTVLDSLAPGAVLSGGKGWFGDGGPCIGAADSSARLTLQRGNRMGRTNWQKTEILKQPNRWFFCIQRIANSESRQARNLSVKDARNGVPKLGGRLEKDSILGRANIGGCARHPV